MARLEGVLEGLGLAHCTEHSRPAEDSWAHTGSDLPLAAPTGSKTGAAGAEGHGHRPGITPRGNPHFLATKDAQVCEAATIDGLFGCEILPAWSGGEAALLRA